MIESYFMKASDTHDRATPEHTGFGRAASYHNAELTETGPGTPCGEYLRRYWQPVALSAEVGPRPRSVKILGEELVVFRDGKGRAGLLHHRCAHRGTSLYYGRIEEEGIRCCYHGWLFDREGRCLDQPCEPQGGLRREQVRQPWYPVVERHGLIFAFMGPPARMPVVPRFDILEELKPGDEIFAHCHAGATGYGDVKVKVPAVPYNWLQFYENSVDPYHVWILHSTFSSVAQFAPLLRARPTVRFERIGDITVIYHALRDVDGRPMDRIGQCVVPNVVSIAPVNLDLGRARSISWVVPVDDFNFLSFTLSIGQEPSREFDAVAMTPDGKTWAQMSDAEHQAYPGDFEAQASQGRITLHSEEHLLKSDEGIVMLRRILLKQIATVKEGKDPAGVAFRDTDALFHVAAGNFLL
jgi:nitrite reductase/ring-hydroxylating ferredoxin subunit